METRQDLERVLLDESISYSRCFNSKFDVYMDIKGSLLSHFSKYDLVKIARECYELYEGPEFEFDEEGKLGKRGWYRVVSDKEFWTSVWRNWREASMPYTMVLRPPFSPDAQWLIGSSTGVTYGILGEGYLGGRVQKAFSKLTRKDKAKIRKWFKEAQEGRWTSPVSFLITSMLRNVDFEELREIADRIGLLDEYIPSQVRKETVKIELERLFYAYRGKIFGTL
jgi:hypothetical protein